MADNAKAFRFSEGDTVYVTTVRQDVSPEGILLSFDNKGLLIGGAANSKWVPWSAVVMLEPMRG